MVVFVIIKNGREPNILANVLDLDRDLLVRFGVGDDEDAAGSTRARCALIAQRLDGDGTHLAFLDGRGPVVALVPARSV